MAFCEKVLKVAGMTCAHCEARINSAMGALDGVSKCAADFRASNVKVVFDPEIISVENIEKTIIEEGYRVKHGNTLSDWAQLAGILAVIAAVYFIVDHTIGFDFIPQINQEMSYGLLLLAGIFTSLHCVSMCGGINVAVCLASKTSKGDGAEMMPSLMYNAGRVVSYTAIGGVIGAIGSVFTLSHALQDGILIISGGLMVITGLAMLGLLNFIRLPMPAGLSKIREKALGKPAFVVGLANGFMPCGPLQMMQLYALGTGSATQGAISMFLFVIGTVPLMFGLGFISTKLKGRAAAKFSMASAIVILLLGAGMLIRLVPTSSAPVQTAQINTTAAAKVQELVTDVGRRSYPAINIKKGVPVRWVLNVTKANLNGCNNRLTIPFLNITKELKVGENVIEFTANESGVFTYQCWMNMIRSTITVGS